jgi:Leucine-rich repeat (LRR) protein
MRLIAIFLLPLAMIACGPAPTPATANVEPAASSAASVPKIHACGDPKKEHTHELDAHDEGNHTVAFVPCAAGGQRDYSGNIKVDSTPEGIHIHIEAVDDDVVQGEVGSSTKQRDAVIVYPKGKGTKGIEVPLVKTAHGYVGDKVIPYEELEKLTDEGTKFQVAVFDHDKEHKGDSEQMEVSVTVSTGKSCERAIDENPQAIDLGAKGGKPEPDLTDAQLGAVMKTSGFFSHCGLKDNENAEICVAVKAGKVLGVSVGVAPVNKKTAACIDRATRKLRFPVGSRIDVVHQKFLSTEVVMHPSLSAALRPGRALLLALAVASGASLAHATPSRCSETEVSQCDHLCRVTEITPAIAKSLSARSNRDTLIIEFASTTTQGALAGLSQIPWVRKLRLKGVGVTDVGPVASSLPDLEVLDLVATGVTSLRPLGSLTKLKHFYFTSGSTLVDPWPGKKLPAKQEAAEKLAQIEPGGVGLIEGLDREDFDELMPRTNNFDPDLSALAQIASLREVRLAGVNLKGAVIKSLAQITTLDLYRLTVDDAASLGALTGLRELDLRKVPVANYDFLKPMAALEQLEIAQNRLQDLKPLAGLKSLRRLMLPENPGLASLAPLKGLTSLESLDIDDTGVSDITPLASLPKVEFLDLQGTQVKSLKPLAKHPTLRVLNLRRTPVKDITPLTSCEAITHVHVPDGVPPAQLEEAKKARPGANWLRY